MNLLFSTLIFLSSGLTSETAGATVHGFDPDVDLKLDQQQLKFQVSVEDGVCPGCGVTFQCIDSSGPGYLPTKEVEMAKDQTSSIIKVLWRLGSWSFRVYTVLRTQITTQ